MAPRESRLSNSRLTLPFRNSRSMSIGLVCKPCVARYHGREAASRVGRTPWSAGDPLVAQSALRHQPARSEGVSPIVLKRPHLCVAHSGGSRYGSVKFTLTVVATSTGSPLRSGG